jgi:uncharacterized protein (DUF952 family)
LIDGRPDLRVREHQHSYKRMIPKSGCRFSDKIRRLQAIDDRNYCLIAQGPLGSRAELRTRHVVMIYKICERASWQAAAQARLYRGSDVDRRDGFIHFSTAAQLGETAAKHFARQSDLMLVAVDGDALGPALKWERSRGGDLFPHLYEALPLATVRWARALPDEVNGARAMPELTP